jgi:glycosyltransferase involved in cell wall biosynthesis
VIRVLIVEQGVGLWGAQRYLLRLAPLLEARGVEQVLAAPADSATAEAWRRSGRRHVVLAVPPERSVRTPDGGLSARLAAREFARTLLLAQRTARLARRVGADVIHANSHWSHVECVLAARSSGRRVVLHLHEESDTDALGRLRGLAVLAADATIAVSGAVARSLGATARRRAIVIRNGIDADRLRPGAARPELRELVSAGDPDALVLLSLSRLDPRKGVDHLIRAVARLPADLSHVRLVVAGAPSLDPANGERLRALAAELLGARVTFLGPRDDVPDLLRAADVFVLASSLEGLPLTILEAQACGTPVVAYPTAGIPEVVTHGETGLLARAGSVDDLAAQIAAIARSPALRATLGRRGRERVVADSSLELQADRQAAVLRDVTARDRRPPRS